MAVLTALELQLIRNGVALTAGLPINYTKAQINAASQAVEDFLTTNQSTVATLINTATSPLVMSAAQKKAVGAWAFWVKYLRDK